MDFEKRVWPISGDANGWKQNLVNLHHRIHASILRWILIYSPPKVNILIEFKAYQAYRNPELDIRYWRTSTGFEVDFILDDW